MYLPSLTEGSRPVTAPLLLKSKATDWEPMEKAMLSAIDLDKLLAVERATVEKGKQ
jgi:hypothetical protein